MSFRFARSPVAPKITITHGGAGSASGSDEVSIFSSAMAMVVVSLDRSTARRALDVAAELLAHGGEDLLPERVLLARAEAREKRGREHVDRHRLFDRGGDRPATFAGILHKAGVIRK